MSQPGDQTTVADTPNSAAASAPENWQWSFTYLREDFQGLRNEFQGLRNEFQNLRNEFLSLRAEVRSDIQELRNEMREFRREMQSELRSTRTWTIGTMLFIAAVMAALMKL